MIEALGLLDEYTEKIENSPRHSQIKNQRKRDKELLITQIEAEFGKNYGEIEVKYEID